VFVDLVIEFFHFLRCGGLVRRECQKVGVLLEWCLGKLALSPEIRGQISVCLLDGEEGSLHEIAHSLGASSGLCVYVLNTGELQHLLWCTGCDDTRTSGGWYKSDRDGTALASDLGWDGVGKTEHVTPIPSSNRNQSKLSQNDSSTNGSGYFLSAFNTKSNMSIVVTNNNECLEAGSLTSTGLLLHWHNLHDLILEFGAQKEVYNLVFLDW